MVDAATRSATTQAVNDYHYEQLLWKLKGSIATQTNGFALAKELHNWLLLIETIRLCLKVALLSSLWYPTLCIFAYIWILGEQDIKACGPKQFSNHLWYVILVQADCLRKVRAINMLNL